MDSDGINLGIKLYRKPEVTVYVRHKGSCPHAENESYPKCDCAKWLRWSQDGKQHKVSAGTRSWAVALEKQEDQQKRLTGGRTVDGRVTEAARQDQQEQQQRQTVAQAIKLFVAVKEGDGALKATIRKLERQLLVFETFLAGRSKFSVADMIEVAGEGALHGAVDRRLQRRARTR